MSRGECTLIPVIDGMSCPVPGKSHDSAMCAGHQLPRFLEIRKPWYERNRGPHRLFPLSGYVPERREFSR